MTTLKIELDTTVLEDEWEYKSVRDSIVENLQKAFNMPYVACLCSSYGWKREPAIRIVGHEDLSPEMIAPNDDFSQSGSSTSTSGRCGSSASTRSGRC